uniref:EF-hand domain-containing protein n=1 Tax=Alexandrium monilatum TaxID=311494 RepID=A0A7S4PTJ9_9DINO|mmetsp:Transcript_45541/g.142903  ORF Transcript_45541/g.142903 Transcript_45541/m.142903 type:complete len:186 (+) Transcript_45541:1-558(+)
MGAAQSQGSGATSLAAGIVWMASPGLCCSTEKSEQTTLTPLQLIDGARGERLEAMVHELFCLQDLESDGLLDEEELIRLNQQIAVLHYGQDTDLNAVRKKFQALFRERLHPQGLPVPFPAFREHMLKALDAMDSDEPSQEMAMEHFIDEASSARVHFLGCETLGRSTVATLLVPASRRAGAVGGR